jgi:hypothetical protein
MLEYMHVFYERLCVQILGVRRLQNTIKLQECNALQLRVIEIFIKHVL